MRNPLAASPCLDTVLVSHYIRVMRARRLKNVTITLEESVARWARLEAARRDTSVSSLLAAVLKDHMHAQSSYDSAMRRALARQPFLKTEGKYMTREEAHARPGVR